MATMPSRRTPRMVVLRMVLELGWDTLFRRWADMMMNFLDDARRRRRWTCLRILTVSNADSSQHDGSACDAMLPRSSEIRDALHRGSTRGALVLPAPPGLDQIRVTAAWADAIDGFVPGDEVTSGVPLAAKERATLLRTTFDN